MNEILTIVLDNVYIVLAFFGLFAICVIADIIAKTFYNVNNVGESFSIEKFVTGIVRMLCVAISASLLASVVGVIPPVLAMAGIEMTEEMISLFTIAGMAVIFLNGIVKYFKSAYETINKIITNEKLFNVYGDDGVADEER